MPDIFISYAREDREHAKLVAEKLQHHGWEVWWDRDILPGKAFDKVIAEALDASKCVVVLWTSNSVESDWVKEEAAVALERGVLVPVLIEEVQIPLGFRRIEAAILTDWDPTASHVEFEQVVESITEIIGNRTLRTENQRESERREEKTPEEKVEHKPRLEESEGKTEKTRIRLKSPLVYGSFGGLILLVLVIIGLLNRSPQPPVEGPGWLGVNVRNVATEGASISQVIEDGPAAEASIRREDIIVEFNGTRIQNANELINLVATTPPGTKVPLRLIRNGKEENLEVKLGVAPKAEISNTGN